MATKKYYWKELTDDGLVKEPKELGPHYGKESLNDHGGFDTEEQALAHLEEMARAYRFYMPSGLVLIAEYCV